MRGPLYSVSTFPLGKVSIMARPRGGDWLSNEIQLLHSCGVDILVSLLTDPEVREFDLREEAECSHDLGIQYLSFPINDRSIPPFSEQTFSFLKQLEASLSEGKHLAFHCRHGLGRSALMAASLLILTHLTPEQALEQLSAARGLWWYRLSRQKWPKIESKHSSKENVLRMLRAIHRKRCLIVQ